MNDNVLATHTPNASEILFALSELARMNVPFGLTENTLQPFTARCWLLAVRTRSTRAKDYEL